MIDYTDTSDCADEGEALYHVLVPRDASAERLALQAAIARTVSAAKRPLTLSVFYSVALIGAEGLWGDADMWSGTQLELWGSCTARMWTAVRRVREAQVLRENDGLVALLKDIARSGRPAA